MDNKVACLNAAVSVEVFVEQNPQLDYIPDECILQDGKGSWAFLWRNDETGNIVLSTERHVSERMLFELLAKYGGEFYKSEYDRKPTQVFPGGKEGKRVDAFIAGAVERSGVGHNGDGIKHCTEIERY